MATENESGKNGVRSQTAATAPMELPESSAATHHRHVRVRSEDFSDDDTVQVLLASEKPCEMRAGEEEERLGIAKRGQKFLEILSHSPGDADLSRLNDSGAFLDEHKDNRHLGKCRKAMVSEDRVTRAVFEFDNATRLSKTRKKQMRAGSRPFMSVGYAHTRYIGAETLPDGRVGHRFAWIGLEGSNVAVPADTNAREGRSTKECHCLACGGLFERSLLNDDYVCEDCDAAETPADESESRSEKSEVRKERANKESRKEGTEGSPEQYAKTHLRAIDATRKFRFARMPSIDNKRDRSQTAATNEEEISFNDIRQEVTEAADSDKRFKVKRENGDVYSNFYVYDILLDGGDWKAVIVGPYPDYKMFEVEFEFDGEDVTLGEAVEVEAVTSYQPVERSQKSEVRSQSGVVDSTPISEQQKNFMPKTVAELSTEFPDAITSIRTETERNTRTAVLDEVKQRSAKDAEKIKARNDEITALANEFCKSHGRNWNGKPGEVYVVADKIRSLQMEICALPADHDAAEARRDFKRKADEYIVGSRAPLVQEQAANLPEEIAGRCSLKRLYNAAARSQANGERTSCYMPKDGAEFEANSELRKRALDFPGGTAIDMTGCILPANIPAAMLPDGRNTRGFAPRRQRDALAGDFGTAGATIAPEFKFPTIELLRNKMALGRAGITILGGVVGNLVLPRQTGATTSQSLAEGAVLAAYDQTFDQIRMMPHRIGSKQSYSRLVLLQSGDDFEALVMNDHMAQNALRADYLVLNGSGANDEPLGLMNQPGIGAVAFAGSASAAYKNCVALETAIRKANIDEAPTFVTTSTARGTLLVTPATLTGSTVVSGASNAIWEGDEILGRPAVDSQQVPGDALVALVGRHVIMAQWGGWMVVLDTLTQADQDKIKLSVNTYIDSCLRHPQAVARSADSLASLT